MLLATIYPRPTMARKISLVASGLVLVSMITLLLTTPYVNASPSAAWSKTYGGLYSDKVYAMVKTQDGGYALAGTTNSFGSGVINAWLVKTNADGDMQWNQSYSGLEQGVADSLVRTSDGGYALAGYTYLMTEGRPSAWIIKTDSNGTLSWNQTYTELGSAVAYGIIQTSDGGYALVGSSNSVGNGETEAWLAKMGSNGSLQWYITYGGSQNDAFYSVVQSNDGGYTMSGDTNSFGSGNKSSLWLVKTDSLGSAQWDQIYSGSSNYIAGSMVKTGAGGYALIGTFQQSDGNDFSIIKTDSSGNPQWNQTYNGLNVDDAISGIQTSDGGYAIVGVTNASNPAYAEAWLVKTDSTGTAQWNQTYGGFAQNVAGAIVQTGDGGYVLAGYTNSTGAGAEDFWLMKTDANGVVTEFPGVFVLPLLAVAGVFVAVLVRKKVAPKIK
jgi:hypothetical protein